MNKIDKINSKIEYLRKKLHKQVYKDKGNISDKALIISQELDEVIVEYIKHKNHNSFLKERR